MLAYPIRELFLRIVDVRGFWGYALPLDVTMSTSMIYELIEWAISAVFSGELGQEYLGTQGDIWDAHKDMALASSGALISMGITLAINLSLQRAQAAVPVGFPSSVRGLGVDWRLDRPPADIVMGLRAAATDGSF